MFEQPGPGSHISVPTKQNQANRSFLSSLVPQFQNESRSENHSYKNDFDFHENEPAVGETRSILPRGEGT